MLAPLNNSRDLPKVPSLIPRKNQGLRHHALQLPDGEMSKGVVHVQNMAACKVLISLATIVGGHFAQLRGHWAEFERELIQKRIRSGIAAAKARGKLLGRQPGQRPKLDRLAPKVLALVERGRSYRLVGREVGLRKNTVAEIVRRNHVATAPHVAPRS